MPRELFLTKRQKTKIRNAFANSMSTDIKLNRVQLKNIIQLSGFFLGNMIGDLSKKALTNLAVPLIKSFLPKLVTRATSSILDNFERKKSGPGAVRAGKGFTLVISNEDMNDVIISL